MTRKCVNLHKKRTILDLSSYKALLKKLTRHTLTPEEIRWVVGRINPVFHVTGKLGPWVLRWHKGKPIISKNAHYNISHTEASIKNRNSMGAAINLAIGLNKIPVIKKIWTASDAEGKNSYTKLIKHCKKNLINNLPLTKNKISPDDYHFEINDVVSFDGAKSIKINTECFTNETLVIVLVPFEPMNTGVKSFEVINLSDGYPAGEIITLTVEQLQICSNYKNYLLYSVVIRNKNNKLQWSNTVVSKGEFAEVEYNSEIDKFLELILILIVQKHMYRKLDKSHLHPASKMDKDHSPRAVCSSAVFSTFLSHSGEIFYLQRKAEIKRITNFCK